MTVICDTSLKLAIGTQKKSSKTGRKNKKYSIFGSKNCSKISTYTVLNALFGECNFEISELTYYKTLS